MARDVRESGLPLEVGVTELRRLRIVNAYGDEAEYEERYRYKKMNIEIANRLVNLRKSNNLSQEALAQKLGISRQAVSKWERAEASPDTDNLILLARLYGVSLDELLKTDDEIPRPDEERMDTQQEGWRDEASGEGENPEYVHVGFGGVHVKDKNGEVHVGWDGIHVDDKVKGDSVHIDKQGVYVNGEKYDKEWWAHHVHFPMTLIIMIVYITIGCTFGAWHPGWVVFLTIPLYYALVSYVQSLIDRRKNCGSNSDNADYERMDETNEEK